MGTKRVGLARTQALIENLKRSIDWNEATLTDVKIQTAKSVNISGDLNVGSSSNYDCQVWPVPNLHNKVAVTGDTTIANSGCFKPHLLDGDHTVTLPGVTIGASFWIINNQDHGSKIRIDPDAADKWLIAPGGSAGGNGKYIELTAGTARRGDFCLLTYGSADGWTILQLGGTWTVES